MRKKLLLAGCFSFAIFALWFFVGREFSSAPEFTEAFNISKRKMWEWKMLRDPATGKVPDGIRGKEIAYAKTLPNDLTNFEKLSNLKSPANENFNLLGPYNVGGRTRALAIDITNENIIFAGGVSGSLWRSADAGNSWVKVTTPDQHLGATCIMQDKRPGKTNTWYYGTGEPYGTSASGGSAFFLGDGMFKSTDSGLTWQPLSPTANGNPQSFTTHWQLIWNIATHPNDTQDIVFAATYGRVYRSLNGGTTFTTVLSSTADSYFTDVAVTTTGVVYATLSSDGGKKGIWRSPDGISAFVNILPSNYPTVYDRTVIGIDPNNENDVYFFSHTPGFGKPSTDFQADTEWVSLWKYSFLSGDGSGTGGQWTELSANLPVDGSAFGNIVVQGSYDMYVRVMPGNSNVIFIGATNLYRSADGFTTPNNTVQIGGYGVGTTLPFFDVYPNHHPDQHNLAFLPSNPNIIYSACDGGVFKTANCLAQNVSWTDLNRGYITSQFYTIAIDHGTNGSNVITGGLQDWGSWWTNSANPEAYWTFPSTGDGSYCAVADGGSAYYYSRQSARIMKATLDNNGNVAAFRRIDPIGANKDNYMFINPFILDATDNNVMYLSEGENLWRNNDLAQIPLTGQWDTISTGWFKYSFQLADTNSDITSLACSKNNPSHRLYFGTDKKKIYKMEDAHTGDPAPVEITSSTMPNNAYVSCIAVDPRNADKLIVVFSNYNIYSIFYSEDAGTNWIKIAGNLEQNANGTGNGPSCRWASILPKADSTLYLVGTSTGLYATDTLIDNATVWTQQGSNSIGNVVVTMMDVRESDGFIAVATHGNGVFANYLSTNISKSNASICSDSCDGSATATVTSGTPPYTFQWSTSTGNKTSPTVTGLCPGKHTVTITDANNIIGVGNAYIGSFLIVSTGSTSAQNDSSATGTAFVTAESGTPPYFYTWNTGETSDSITNLLPGIYHVTATDKTGCTSETSVVIQSWPTGKNEITNPYITWKIYPNPAKETIALSFENTESSSQNINVELRDVSGRLVYQSQFHSNQSQFFIDVSKFSNGIYFCIVIADEKKSIKKLIITGKE